MARFAELLSTKMDLPVIDRTGLTGVFNIQLDWTPESSVTADSTPGPTIFAAIQEKLGLKLQNLKAPIQLLVVDHADMVPGAN